MFIIVQSTVFLYNDCTTWGNFLYNAESRLNAGARGRNRTGTPCGGGFWVDQRRCKSTNTGQKALENICTTFCTTRKFYSFSFLALRVNLFYQQSKRARGIRFGQLGWFGGLDGRCYCLSKSTLFTILSSMRKAYFSINTISPTNLVYLVGCRNQSYVASRSKSLTIPNASKAYKSHLEILRNSITCLVRSSDCWDKKMLTELARNRNKVLMISKTHKSNSNKTLQSVKTILRIKNCATAKVSDSNATMYFAHLYPKYKCETITITNTVQKTLRKISLPNAI